MCAWWMNQDDQNSTKIKCQGQEFAHREGKTSALKPVLWNMVLCFYFNVVWVIFPHLWLPQKASASSLFRLKSNCCLTLHHSSVQGARQSSRETSQKLCFTSVFANSIWSSIWKWSLILLRNTELAKIYNAL